MEPNPFSNHRTPESNSDDDIVLASLRDEADEDVESLKPPSKWTAPLVIFGIVLLVLGPVVWRLAPREVASWHLAAAVEHRLAGEDQAAEEQLAQAFKWDPESASAFAQRGEWKLEAKQYTAAVEDYSRAIQLQPGNPGYYIQRSVALQHLDEHERAIDDWRELQKMFQQGNQELQALVLNGLAYAQAVANKDLDEALENVNEALQLAGWNAQMLDTRGYIQYLRGDYEAARKDLERAVRDIESDLIQLKERQDFVDRRIQDVAVKGMEESVAVLYYHRALVYEKLGEAELAAKDLQRVEDLGCTPGKHLF